MKNAILKLFVVLFFMLLFLLFSCGTKRSFKHEKETVKTRDSIVYVGELRIDTVIKNQIITKTEPVYNTIKIPCDSANFYQDFNNGKSGIKIEKKNGQVEIKYIQNPLFEYYKSLYESSLQQNDSLKSVINNTAKNELIDNNVVKLSFWQMLKTYIWQVLFTIILILWVLGFTPKYLISNII